MTVLLTTAGLMTLCGACFVLGWILRPPYSESIVVLAKQTRGQSTRDSIKETDLIPAENDWTNITQKIYTLKHRTG